jgi:hypothetical protein
MDLFGQFSREPQSHQIPAHVTALPAESKPASTSSPETQP